MLTSVMLGAHMLLSVCLCLSYVCALWTYLISSMFYKVTHKHILCFGFFTQDSLLTKTGQLHTEEADTASQNVPKKCDTKRNALKKAYI